jgi:4'-phosphopantetheinyl transferase EntD
LTGLLPQLLAPGLHGAEIWDVGQDVVIHPQENRHVGHAAEKRRRDFALGRACARAALSPLGHGEAVIATGEAGAPVWPGGIVGSITHTKGYAAAIAGEASRFDGIGVDAERVGGVGEELWPRLFTGAERAQLMTQQGRDLAATLLFSAKEAAYKAWALKGALTFRAIEIVLEEGSFTASRSGGSLRGRFGLADDLVLTLAWIPR